MAATDGGDMMLPTGYITSSLGMHTLGPDGIIGIKFICLQRC